MKRICMQLVYELPIFFGSAFLAIILIGCSKSSYESLEPNTNKDNWEYVTDICLYEDGMIFAINDRMVYSNIHDEKQLLIEDEDITSICFGEEGNVYYSQNDSIICYNIGERKTTRIINLKSEVREVKEKVIILCVVDPFLFFHVNGKNYGIDLTGDQIFECEYPIQNMISTSAEGIIYQSDDYSSVFFYDVSEQKEILLTKERSKLPVICAEYTDGILLFARSNGFLRTVCVDGKTDERWKATTETMGSDRIYEICLEEDVFYVVSRENGKEDIISLTAISRDGEKRKVEDFDKPLYSVPGSCILEVNGGRYAFAVSTSDVIRTGNLGQ